MDTIIKKEIEEIKKLKLEEKIREMADNLENFRCLIEKSMEGDKTEYSFGISGSRTSNSEIVLSGTSEKGLPEVLNLTINGKLLYNFKEDSSDGLGYLYTKAIKLWKEKMIVSVTSPMESSLLQTTFIKEKERN